MDDDLNRTAPAAPMTFDEFIAEARRLGCKLPDDICAALAKSDAPAAPLVADLPPPLAYLTNDRKHLVFANHPHLRNTEFMTPLGDIAPYAERINALVRDLANLRAKSGDVEEAAYYRGFKFAQQPAGSIGDDATFTALATQWAGVLEMYEDDEHRSVVEAWAALIAHIDGRTAGTAQHAEVPACRDQGGVCACRAGGSFGGCAIERAAAPTNQPKGDGNDPAI